MAKYHNKNLRILMAITSGGTATPLVGVTEWSIDQSVDTVETTAGGDSNKTFVQGLPNGTISFAGLWDDTETKLVAGAASTSGCKMFLYPDYSNAAGKYVTGVFWLSINFQNSISDAAKWTASAVPSGSVTNNL